MAEHHFGGAGAVYDDNPEYRETPPGAGHEYTDANVWLIVKFGLWLLVTAIVVHAGMWLMFQLFAEQTAQRGEAEYPLAVGQEQRLPPPPRLQQFPANELYEFRRREEQILNSYGWENRDAGTVRIPIAEAMRLTVERGLPARPQAEQAPAPAPDLMPADSSSGRTMERRRQ